MELDATACYRAIAGRDRRFEGRFVVAVVTTRVYCRPGCPAPIPRRKNVQFYPTAAAAEEAGFRPCRRCRPDASPGTPAWLGTSATVSRALRLLAVNGNDTSSIETLAARLGIGGRHLRRLFLEHLGAPPRAVVQSRRAHFARKLLDETDLPMTAVAAAAGYSSLRRFNDAVRRTFRATPTELRRMREAREARGGRGRDAAPAPAGLTLRLPYRPPLDWEAVAGYLARRATPGVERVDSGRYRRTIEWSGTAGWIEVRPGSDARSLQLHLNTPATRDLLALVDRVNRIFDLGADPERIGDSLSKDRSLAPLLRKMPGLRVPGAWDPFELSIRAILGQQVSVPGATTLAGRLVQEYGRPLPVSFGPGLTHLFPGPHALAETDAKRIGIPEARAETIREFSRAVRDGRIRFGEMRELPEIVSKLTAIPGIGDWTAQYVALRALGEPDAFPASDLGIRQALGRNGKALSTREALRRSEAWKPWRGYAAVALWMSAGTHSARRSSLKGRLEPKGNFQ